MEVGTVYYFNRERAFGFIRKIDGTSVFFHARHLQEFNGLRVQGQNVEFFAVKSRPHYCAILVRPISSHNEDRRIAEVIRHSALHAMPNGHARKKVVFRPAGMTRKAGSHRDGRRHK